VIFQQAITPFVTLKVSQAEQKILKTKNYLQSENGRD